MNHKTTKLNKLQINKIKTKIINLFKIKIKVKVLLLINKINLLNQLQI